MSVARSTCGISGGRIRACFRDIFLLHNVDGHFHLNWKKKKKVMHLLVQFQIAYKLCLLKHLLENNYMLIESAKTNKVAT